MSVFLDISINNGPPERLVIQLFYYLTPKAAENFRALCAGDKGIGCTTGKPLHYKGCLFHTIYKGLGVQGGDFSEQNGTGGESIYGGTFPGESLPMSRSGPGVLMMANNLPDKNGSGFIICFRHHPFLDGCHVAFGRVIKGMETVQKIEQLGTPSGKPYLPIVISECGEISEDKKSNVIETAVSQESNAEISELKRIVEELKNQIEVEKSERLKVEEDAKTNIIEKDDQIQKLNRTILKNRADIEKLEKEIQESKINSVLEEKVVIGDKKRSNKKVDWPVIAAVILVGVAYFRHAKF